MKENVKVHAEAILELLTESGSEEVLPDILAALRARGFSSWDELIAAFDEVYDAKEGRVKVSVVNAVPLSLEERKRVAEILGSKVQPIFAEDPALIGGIRLVFPDRIIDGSFKGVGERLREAMVSEHFL